MTTITNELIAKHHVPGTDHYVAITFQSGQNAYTVSSYQVGGVFLRQGNRPTEREARELANRVWMEIRSTARNAERRTAAPKAQVPAGRYAVELDGKLGFFKVDQPTEGRWAGYTFVKQMASDTEYPVRGFRRGAVLDAIATDPQAASVRYGQEIGACGVCGRTLTDEDSRARGIGPICADKMGW